MRAPALGLAVALIACAAAANDVTAARWKACMPSFGHVSAKDYPRAVFGVPSSGGTGIFVIRKGDGRGGAKPGEAVKFMKVPDAGPVFARAVLAKMGLPHDPLIGFTDNPAEVTKARDLFAQAQADGLFQGADPDRVTLQISRISNRDSGVPGPPAAMLRTGLVTPAGHGETLGAMLTAVSGSDAEKASDLLLAVSALKHPANQKFLGALFIADLVVGNGDRMSKGAMGQWTPDSPNWNNLVVGVGPKAGEAPCLVAIDNDAAAPSTRQLLFDKALAHEGREADDVQSWMTVDELVDALVLRNVEDGAEVYGPAVAFGAPLQGGYPRCSDRPDGAGVISDEQLGRIVRSLRRWIQVGAGKIPGVDIVAAQTRPNCAEFVRWTAVGQPMREQGIDWREFETNFDRGVALALEFFASKQPNWVAREASKSHIVTHAAEVKAHGPDRLSRTAVRARIAFLQHLVAQPDAPRDAQQAIAAMKTDPKLKSEEFRSNQLHRFGALRWNADWGVMQFD